MANRDYIIGTGYYHSEPRKGKSGHVVVDYSNAANFYSDIWLPNTMLGSSPLRICVTNSASTPVESPELVQWINLAANPGHGRFSKKRQMTGWASGFVQGALYAYMSDADYIYKEQDCLCFGDWVPTLYRELESTGCEMLVGELVGKGWQYRIELCLTIMKWEYILPFLAQLLSEPNGSGGSCPERKFWSIKEQSEGKIGYMSFGYGGNRPFEIDDVFYIQKPRWNTIEHHDIHQEFIGSSIPVEELERLHEHGLIDWKER